LLEGDFETSYTEADNRKVIATDSIKNTIYVLAKHSQHVMQPERFAQEIACHFLDTYQHVSDAHVRILLHRWCRLTIDGKPHPHAFYRDGEEKRWCEVHVQRVTNATPYTLNVTSGISDLLVLKTTGSSFTNFLRDRFTTLPEAEDRILSTIIEASWQYRTTLLPANGQTHSPLTTIDYDTIYQKARDITLRVFANDNSASVQATLYRMAHEFLNVAEPVTSISYALPNKHVFTVDLKPFGLKNTDKDATVFMPFDAPSGLITATISRRDAKL
jgi:urate oxidase